MDARTLTKFAVGKTLSLVETVIMGVSISFGLFVYAAAFFILKPYLAYSKTLFLGHPEKSRFFYRNIWGDLRAITNPLEVKRIFGGRQSQLICGCVLESPNGNIAISKVKVKGQLRNTVIALNGEESVAAKGMERRHGNALVWKNGKAEVSQCLDCNEADCPLHRLYGWKVPNGKAS